jgi:hypothetical protein
MSSAEVLRPEISHYLILTDQLKALYQDIDDETLVDTLEGISELPELIRALVRSSLDDDVLIAALKQRIENMQARLSRLKDRFERKRELACWAMSNAEITKVEAEDFTLSLRQGPPRVEVTDEEKIPEEYLIPQRPKVDRAGITSALKRGDVIPGTILINGEAHIAVRVR